MELNKELVEKFLSNQCTDSEADEVLAYFNEHPYELEQYIPVDHWLADDKTPLNATASERILQHIRETYEPEKHAGVTRRIVRYAVAASLTGIVVLTGIKLFTGTTSPAAEATVGSIQNTGGAQELKTVENKTKQVMRIRLPDSSVAALYPNSSLQYLTLFQKERRDLYLKGKAQFKVTRIPSRPFTVYTEGIATTVLGTRFLVTEQQNKKVSVTLMEGMVRVWSQHTEDSDRSVILNPGDEVAVTGGEFSNYSLIHNAGKNGNRSPGETKAAPNDGSVDAMNNLVFKNNKLKDVFKRMEEKFGVTINDEKARGIKDKLFTGKFLEEDSLDFIVKTICNWYGLQYRIEGSIVTIAAK
jgi:transmembrane sensor